MKQEILTITENSPVTESVWRMRLGAPGLEEQKPGGFVNIRLDGLYLRRPISVCDWEPGQVTVIYRVVGRGTDMAVFTAAGYDDSGTDTTCPKPVIGRCCWAAGSAYRPCICWRRN